VTKGRDGGELFAFTAANPLLTAVWILHRESVAVFNLNTVGARMLVIRAADSFAGEQRMVAGPFNPQPVEADVDG